MSLIIPNLYLCSYQQAKNLARKNKNVFVINCTKELPMCAERGLRIAVDDDGSSESNNIMSESLEIILKNSNVIDNEIKEGNIIIVHCLAGLQRSPTVITAYLMQKHDFKMKEAIEFLQTKASYAFMDGIHFAKCLESF
jgi:hypothetical protein